MRKEVELLSELEANKVKKKILNMLGKNQYSKLEQYLALNKSEIARFPINKVYSILSFLLNFLSDCQQLAFLNNSKNVPRELLKSALNYRDSQLLKGFVDCQSEIDKLVKKPAFDYRALRTEKFFQLICIDPEQVIQSMKKLVLENPNNIYISEDIKFDFKNAMQKYNNMIGLKQLENLQETNKLSLKRPLPVEYIEEIKSKKFKY